MAKLAIQHEAKAGMYTSVASIDPTKVHLHNPETGARLFLPVKDFSHCTLDSAVIVTVAATVVVMEAKYFQHELPLLEGFRIPEKEN